MLSTAQEGRNAAYAQLLARAPDAEPTWDVVALLVRSDPKGILTAEVNRRKEVGLLPPQSEYLVIEDDPPGAGSGGAVLSAMHRLKKAYGCEKLSQLRVLLLPCGGTISGRPVPQWEGGRVFAPVPWRLGERPEPCTMLDVKLMGYLGGLLASLPLGSMIIGWPEMLTFYDNQSIDCVRPGLVVLAHQGSLETASGHAVLLLSEEDKPTAR